MSGGEGDKLHRRKVLKNIGRPNQGYSTLYISQVYLYVCINICIQKIELAVEAAAMLLPRNGELVARGPFANP